jgi:predicted DNA-binding transcriptional regulator AlpA
MPPQKFLDPSSQETPASRANGQHRSAAEVPLLLLDRHQSAAALGVSCRTFEEMMDAPWMPRPVQLGPRLLRWPFAELQEAIANMP